MILNENYHCSNGESNMATWSRGSSPAVCSADKMEHNISYMEPCLIFYRLPVICSFCGHFQYYLTYFRRTRPQAEWGRGWHVKRAGDFPQRINKKTKTFLYCKMNFFTALLSSKYKDTANSSENKITVQIFSVLASICVQGLLFKIQIDRECLIIQHRYEHNCFACLVRYRYNLFTLFLDFNTPME